MKPGTLLAEKGRRLRGYIGTNTVRIRPQSLEQLGPTIDAALSAAGYLARLHGLRFARSGSYMWLDG